MRIDDIEVGGFYHDGKLGLREVIARDPGLRVPGVGDKPGQDPIRYRILHAKSAESYLASEEVQQTREHNCERASLAAWAKARVEPDEVPSLLAKLHALAFKPSSRQAQVVLRLEQEQGESNHLIPLLSGEKASLGKLVGEGFVIAPSGQKLARLTEEGRQLAQKLLGNLTFESVQPSRPSRKPKI